MLELKNLSYTINEGENEKKILDNISLTIGDNEFVAITGPNGSGKSTLAKIIAGIINPTEGNIFFEGSDITKASITDRAKMGISYAFQQPVHFKGIKVRELISLAAGTKLKVAQLREYLSRVGLDVNQYMNRQVDSTLSGGELKRIELATIFARNGKILLFDEPEAGIDLWSFQSLIQTFEKLKEKENCCVIIISHQEKIINAADRVILLSEGRIDKPYVMER
ncbi:MAG: ABC transporter ATP-binding protein [Lachnospiraceae bacterium]